MFRFYKIIITFILVVITSCTCFAQPAAFIPDEGNLFVFPVDTVAIFSNLINNGNIGSLPGSVVNFYGQQWNNADSAQLYGNGGNYRFLIAAGDVGNSGPQFVLGGYHVNTNSGVSFPNLSIENPGGLYLEDLSDLKIRDTLNFTLGHLYLNGWNAVVGENNPGAITGYDNNSYVVTGSSIAGGYLYRTQVPANDTALIYPVGTSDASYSPAAVAPKVKQDIAVNVFDTVYSRAIAGTPQTVDYVVKTWRVQQQIDSGSYDIALQHDVADEGYNFNLNRDSSYVSQYNFQQGLWDMDQSRGIITPGPMTTGAPQSGTYMNTRPGINAAKHGYFAVSDLAFDSAYKQFCPVVNFTMLQAQRYTVRYVQLYWTTDMELNVKRFEIQRKRQNETDFTTIAVVDSKAGGNTNQPLVYNYKDDNYYDDWTYYRIKIIGPGGCVKYSDIQKVPWDIIIEVNPNPNDGHFNVHLFGVKHKLNMRLTNTLGQILNNYIITKDQTITVTNLPEAMYYLTFYDMDAGQQMIKTIKIEVIKK